MMEQRRFLFFTLTILAFFFLLVNPARADKYGIDATVSAVNKGSVLLPKTVAGGKTVPEVVGNVVAIGLSMVGIVFFILALYAGFVWMSAMGNTESVTKAKDILEAAAIGLVIVLAAYAISSFVFTNIAPDAGGSVDGITANGGTCKAGVKDGDKCGNNSVCSVMGKIRGTPAILTAVV